MRAIVTGSAGFVGRHMVAELKARGYSPVTEIDVAAEAYPQDAVEYFNHPHMSRETRKPFDLLVHCAYHIGGRLGIENDREAFARNLALDAAAFDFAARGMAKRMIYYSSSAVYPVEYQARGAGRLSEDDAEMSSDVFNADARYGFGKLVGERLAVEAMAANPDLGVSVLRPFSGYGEDQSLDYPFPSIMKRVVEKVKPFPIWGDASQVRDWIHIDDIIRLSLDASDCGVIGPINLCSGVGVSMLDLARLAWRAHHGSIEGFELHVEKDMPMGVHTRVGDPGEMEDWLGKPLVSLVEGVRRSLKYWSDRA
jgi:nucleoside-diphosphate-sugar epimerase